VDVIFVLNMSESFLVELVPLLGHSCRNTDVVYEGDADKKLSPRSSHDKQNIYSFSTLLGGCDVECKKLSYPSFSLSHRGDGTDSTHRYASSSREEVQVKASAWMSQPIVLEDPGVEQLEQIPRQILENVLDSFDQLVDARIRQYSKVLSNYYLSLPKEAAMSAGARVVEYKLRRLLEFGTNISFGSISTNFTPMDVDGSSTVQFTVDDDGRKEHSLPIQLTVEIQSLQFLPPCQEQLHVDAAQMPRTSIQGDPNHFDDIVFEKMSKLTLQVPGFIRGKGKRASRSLDCWLNLKQPGFCLSDTLQFAFADYLTIVTWLFSHKCAHTNKKILF
jgi:hypothetical protein